MRTLLAALLRVLLVAAAAAAQEKRITLPPDHAYGHPTPAPGGYETQTQCQFCHSTDYSLMQPRGAPSSEGVVTKTIKVFGAPVTDADAKTITDYLARAYGPAR